MIRKKITRVVASVISASVIAGFMTFPVNADTILHTWEDAYASDFNDVSGLPITTNKSVVIDSGVTATVKAQWGGATGTSKIEGLLHSGSETDNYLKLTQQGSGYVPELTAIGDAYTLDNTSKIDISFDFMAGGGGAVRFGIDDDGLSGNKYFIDQIMPTNGAPGSNNMSCWNSVGGYLFYYNGAKAYLGGNHGSHSGIPLTNDTWYNIDIEYIYCDAQRDNAQTVRMTVYDISGDTPVEMGTYKGVLDAVATGEVIDGWNYQYATDTTDELLRSINGVRFDCSYQTGEWYYGIDNLSVDVTKETTLDELYSDSKVMYADLDMDTNTPAATYLETGGKDYSGNKTDSGLANGEYELAADAPGEENNKAFKFATSAANAADYPVMASVQAHNTNYVNKGLNANKTTFASARLRLTSEDLATLKTDSTKFFEFGLGVEAYSIFAPMGNIKVFADEDGENFNVGGVKIAPDTWFTVDWKYRLHESVGGYYTNNKMAVNITANGVTSTATWSYVHGADYNWTWMTVGTGSASGLQIRTPQATAVNGIYVDDIKIWQIKNDIGAESITLDADNGNLTVKYNTLMVKSEAEKAVLMLGLSAVTGALSNPSVQADPHIVIYDIDMSKLAFSTAYTIELPANTVDANGQVAYDKVSIPYNTPTSFTISIAGTPTITGGGTSKPDVDFILQNISNSEGTVWVIIAAFDSDNMMIDSASGDIKVDANSTTAVTDLEFTKDCSSADNIRIFVWETRDSLKSVQRSVEVWNK